MSSSSSPSSLSSLQLWFLPELKRAFPLAEDWLLDGLSQTCVASASVEEMCDAMRNFIGEEAVAEALRLSEMLFEKKKDYQEEEKKTNSPSSSSFRDEGELKLRKVKEKTKTTSDGDGGKEEDQKKGEAKAYRKYDSIEKPSCTNDQTSSKATNSVVRPLK